MRSWYVLTLSLDVSPDALLDLSLLRYLERQPSHRRCASSFACYRLWCACPTHNSSRSKHNWNRNYNFQSSATCAMHGYFRSYRSRRPCSLPFSPVCSSPSSDPPPPLYSTQHHYWQFPRSHGLRTSGARCSPALHGETTSALALRCPLASLPFYIHFMIVYIWFGLQSGIGLHLRAFRVHPLHRLLPRGVRCAGRCCAPLSFHSRCSQI